MSHKVLIANRGEIACRIIETAHEMGIRCIAIYVDADKNEPFVHMSDQSIRLPDGGYLDSKEIIKAAKESGAQAIHPGYGFLSENAKFSEIVSKHGIKFIGPSAEIISKMGDKIEAKKAALAANLPIVPGGIEPVSGPDAALAAANEAGYPVLLKAAAGGGGRGMQRVESSDTLRRAFEIATSEAEAAFGDGSVYVEKAIEQPRHIEVQVLGDGKGAAVHLGERDCTVQRRFQKLIEEAPSPVLSPEQRAYVGKLGADLAASIDYRGAGTVEFLYADGNFYFIEMNARLQVEHPVTELVSGVDIVEAQLRIASGGGIGFKQDEICFNGHAIEARINAEDPDTFTPSPGRITLYHPPGGPGVRVDSHMFQGATVPPFYDSLIAKLIVHADDRAGAIARLDRALGEYAIDGVSTNLPLQRRILASEDFIQSEIDVVWLERWLKTQ